MFLINVDVNLKHAILQHYYFKAPLFHYKTLLVHHSSMGSSESLSDCRLVSVNQTSEQLLLVILLRF